MKRKALEVLQVPEKELDDVDHYCAVMAHDLRQIKDHLARKILMNNLQQQVTNELIRQQSTCNTNMVNEYASYGNQYNPSSTPNSSTYMDRQYTNLN